MLLICYRAEFRCSCGRVMNSRFSKLVEWENTMIESKPYAKLKYREVKNSRMAYIDEGDGDAIVFQHGQPASSYVWRNVMPHLEGMGRLIACDLIGMGRSDKLDPSMGPDRYSFASHRNYLFELWDQLDLGNRVVLVLDDWGAVLGFEWARQNSQRVQGIVHMEAIAAPLNWSDLPEHAHPLFKALRSPEGEQMVLEENIFIEKILPQAVIRQFTEDGTEPLPAAFPQPGRRSQADAVMAPQPPDRGRARRGRRSRERERQLVGPKRCAEIVHQR